MIDWTQTSKDGEGYFSYRGIQLAVVYWAGQRGNKHWWIEATDQRLLNEENFSNAEEAKTFVESKLQEIMDTVPA